MDAASRALNLEIEALRELNSRLVMGAWSDLPRVELLSSSGMGGTIGAWASTTQTIYLNSDWLSGASKEQIIVVLTEEFGHYLDSQFNKTDTKGDEGELFSKILGGEGLSSDEVAAIRSENDAVILTLANGSRIQAEAASLTGGEGNDTLKGTNSADTIKGRGGNDVINGLAGNDIIDGGNGNDTISGGGGDDQIFTGLGNVSVDAGNGNDLLGLGTDLPTGNYGSGAYDPGMSLIFANAGDGSDTVFVDNSDLAQGSVIDGGSGDDKIFVGSLGNGTYIGGDGSYPGNFSNNIWNSLRGFESYFVAGYYGIVDKSVDEANGIYLTAFPRYLSEIGFNDVVLSDYNFIGISSSRINVYTGDGLYIQAEAVSVGSLNVSSLRGSINFSGGAMGDRAVGIDGNFDDIFEGNGGNDYFDGGDGTDIAIFSGNSSDYTILEIAYNTFQVKDNRADNPDGTDTIVDVNKLRFADGDQDIFISGLKIVGDASAEVIDGSSNSDYIDGAGGNDVLRGLDGNDVVIGGAGDDLIIGGSGKGNDQYRGGSGSDTVRYTSALAAITINLKTGTASSTVGGDVAGIGRDSLSTIENVTAGRFNDTFIGDAQNNRLDGWLGNDSMNAGSGNDSLIGGEGRDTLSGSSGVDKFVYRSISESRVGGANRDLITDFLGTSGEKIDLSAIDAFSKAPGNQAFTFIGSKSFTGSRGEVRFSKGILQLNTGTDKVADMEISLTGVISFRQDFLIL
jgi:Ca2+-binding RTX toxin-like protein